MALSSIAFRNSVFRTKCYFLESQSHCFKAASCWTLQQRYVQSQKNMRHNKQVPKPWQNLVEKFESKFQRRFPKVYKIYWLFKHGTKSFIADSKQYYYVSKRIRSGEALEKFHRRELELIVQLPRQMVKVVPMLILYVVPFGFYFVIPLAYFFPRQLLCRHYWTENQRLEFAAIELKHRVSYYDDILKNLQESAKKLHDNEMCSKITDLVNHKIAARSSNLTKEVLSIRPAFSSQYLNVHYMPWPNMVPISRSIKLSLIRSRLLYSCRIMMHADKALAREKLDILSDIELRELCCTRGLNPVDLTRNQMVNYLKQWMDVTNQLESHIRDCSLYLHLPALLSRHHPNNQKLLITNEKSR